ncbi:hypothetical protein GQX74_010321 [Glossina fuscipes]|nr:hypothetical protein GQX74_010321 [Glossina fuscipes]
MHSKEHNFIMKNIINCLFIELILINIIFNLRNFLDGFSNAAESCSLFRTMFFFSKPMSVWYFRPLQSHRTSGGNPPKLSLHIMSGDRDNVTKLSLRSELMAQPDFVIFCKYFNPMPSIYCKCTTLIEISSSYYFTFLSCCSNVRDKMRVMVFLNFSL